MAEWSFTAPVAGTYHFHICGIVLNPSPLFSMYISSGKTAFQTTYVTCRNCSTQSVSMISTFTLKAKQEIQYYIPPHSTGKLQGDHTYVTGWLVEEDIALP